MTVPTFDVRGPLPQGLHALEASAGTGKTWAIAALVTRYVAEGEATLDELLVVTFTRAATAELRDRIRQRLAEARRHLARVLAGAPGTTGDPLLDHLATGSTDDVRLRRDRLHRAVSSFDAATITTIHGFCQRVLASVGHVGDIDGTGRLLEDVDDLVGAIVNDTLASHLVDADEDTVALAPSADLVAEGLRVTTGHPDARVRPGADRDVPVDDPEAAGVLLARVVADARRRLDARKRAAGSLTFDDLLHRLADSLEDPMAGPTVLASLQRRYRVALVDEFQDTDPVQWRILSAVFDDRTLVLIGDPKQAIYKFRGADVHAYLDARSRARQATLATNFRSDRSLVQALGRLFEGTTFGHDDIRHVPVDAHFDDDRFHLPTAAPPLQVRTQPKYVAADASRRHIARDVAAEVTRLLASGATIRTAGDGDGVGPSRRPVRAGDCAVLVRTNVNAEAIAGALAEAGVHAVVNGVGSVLDQPARRDWELLLSALERPSSAPRALALALSPVLGRTPAQVAALREDEVALADLHTRLHRWATVATEHGVATLVRTVQREAALPARLLGQEGGDRWLTDFDHLGELLHTAASQERRGPAALLGWLAEQAGRSDELPSEQVARRLESDAHAVQVMTIHRAKGLQFPVVFCPFLMSQGRGESIPHRFRDPATGEPTIDLGSSQADVAKDASAAETAGEDLRLLYVALTRAEHRLVVWWFAKYRGGHARVALSKVLFGTGDDGPRVRHDRDAVLPGTGQKAVGQALAAAAARLGDLAEVVTVPDEPEPVAWQAPAEVVATPAARPFTGDVDHTWTRTSYSRLATPVATRPMVESTPDEVALHLDEDDLAVGDAPTTGGAAEGASTGPTDDAVWSQALPLGGQPAGARFGTLCHAVVEHVDLADVDLDAAMRATVADRARVQAMALDDPTGLAAGLATAMRTPLGTAFGDHALAGTPREDRLDELTFELPLAQDGRDGVSVRTIADLLRTHLPDDDPHADYADRLRDPGLQRRVRGWLTGSIDLVLRRHTEAGPVFHVIDHKSNRLHGHDELGTTWHYRPAALRGAMADGHYVLQALLYQVALHRFLRWRLAGYDPAVHLGAVGYTFLRGMVGPATPREDGVPAGVATWHPPVALVTALSDRLGGVR